MTVYNKYSKTLLVTLLVFSAMSPSLVLAEGSKTEKEYKDVKQEYSSYESIKSLTERGIINGYADGSFKPFAPISRAHVAKLVAEMLEMDLDNVENPNFKDVPKTHPYFTHIAALANAGITSGFQDGNFGPENSLTRSQIAKIISEAFDFEQKALLSKAFIDVQNSDHFAKYLQTLIDKKITVGTTPTTFSPYESVTRGQLATFLYRSDISVKGSYISADISEVSGNQLITSKGSFEISSNLSGLFDEKNLEALQNAHIAFRTNDNKITAIEVLELNSSGTTANSLVFDGGLNTIAGDVVINADNIQLKSLVIEEDLILGEEVKTAFAGKDLTINGETVVQESSLTASISSFVVATEKVSGTLDFDNVKMYMLHVAKKDFKFNFKNNSSVDTMDILQNVIIESKGDSKITNLNISGSVSEVVLNANIQNLLLSSKEALTISGSGNIKNAKFDGLKNINIYTTGIIENLDVLVDILIELGSKTKVVNIAVPQGIEIKDIIENYQDIKGNIDNVGGVKNPDATPPVVTPPPSSGGGNSGGGNVQVPVASVSSISVTNATTVEVVMAQINGVSFTWNGVTPDNVIHDGTKYQLTVPADSMKLNNTLVVSASGYSSSTKTFVVTESTGNLKVISDVQNLNSAIAGQEDGQTWLIKDGDYNHGRFDLVPVVSGQNGWYFPITVDNLTIVGESKEGTTITSDTQSSNGSWSSQDHISVWGDKVTIQNLTIKPKISTNKTIEVMGKDFTLSNVNFEQRSDQTEEFAGSLYFNPQNEDKDIGNVLIENVLINDAWISAGDAVLEGSLTLKNTTIDFRGSEYANAYGGYGVISKNEVIKVSEGSSFKVLADNSLVSLQRQILDRVPKGTIVELSSGTYYVSEDLVVPTDVILDKDKNEAVVEKISEGTALVSNVTEFNAALLGNASVIRMAAGTYEFDSQIRIEKALSIIGVEGQTRITKGDKEWTNATGSKGYAPIITIMSGENSVNLENLNISGADNIAMTLPGSGTDYGSGINVVNSSNVTLKNITSNNNAAAGLIVNSSTVNAVNFNTSGNGWYGVNIDNVSKSTDVLKSNFTLSTGTISEAIQIVSDKGDVTVDADSFKKYNVAGTTQSVWTNKELTYGVVIEGKNTIYSSLQAAVDAADSGSTIKVSEGIYDLSKQLLIKQPVTIKGNGEVIIKAALNFDQGTYDADKHLIAISSINGLVKLENLVIRDSKRNGINVFESTDVYLKNVVSKNNAAAGLVVNNSKVVADNFNTSGNTWYGVNVDNGSNASDTSPKTSFTLNSGTISEEFQIVSDKGGVEIFAPNSKVLINDIEKVLEANITSWYGENNQYLDTSVNINFNNILISNIDSIKFSLYNNNTLLGTRFSSGDNLVKLFKDSAQYWGESADTYAEVRGVRTLSAAFMKREVGDNNGYWTSSAIEIDNNSIPNGLVVEVVVDNMTYYTRK